MVESFPRITDSEWLIMKIIWDAPSKTGNEIVKALEGEKDWKPNTTKTLIGRLVKKGILGYRAEGNIYHYYPLVSREDCVKEERRSFVDRVFTGSVNAMLLNFIDNESLKPEEIEALRRRLSEKTGK